MTTLNNNQENDFVATPEKILPTGIDESLSTNPYTGESGRARKGTVAATLNNVAALNHLLQYLPSVEKEDKIRRLLDATIPLIPSLKVIGMFDFFSVKEWISASNQPGRALIAILYLQHYPSHVTPEIKNVLQKISQSTTISLLKQAIDQLI